MNFFLDQIPERTVKPRTSGLTMVMDKGLGVRQTEDFIESAAPFIGVRGSSSSLTGVTSRGY